MSNKIYLQSVFGYREDTLENWQNSNPVLKKGEPSIVRDGTEGEWLKIGDGKTPWNDLPWKKGPRGDAGPIGPQGPAGDDYILTQADKEEIADIAKPEIDQTYNPESENAQSGKAVAQAVNFNLLYSTEITQEAFDEAGEEGITLITLGSEDKTFSGINQLRVLINLPKSDTINTTNNRLAIRATDKTSDTIMSDYAILLRGNGSVENTSIALLYNYAQKFCVTLDFIDNKFIQGISTKNIFGSYTYGAAAYGFTNSDIDMSTKKYIHILSYGTGDNMSKFKFPVGTKIDIYGR